MPAKEIFFVAAEASADLHGSAVARELRRTRPDLALAGIGGRRMRDAGVELIEEAERLAVMGFVEVIGHVPRHWALLREIRRRLADGRVALVVLMDYPGFNMKVARAAREAGVPVLYYITPQVWAWGAGRLDDLAKTVTRAAVILPFEEALLRAHGIDAVFVGHPLLDHATALPDRGTARSALSLPADAPVLALFPGSRMQEITRHLDAFVAVGHEMARRVPALRIVVAASPTVELRDGDSPFPVVRNESFTVLRAADAALCKSGTTTLEAAVAGCPLVVAYRTSAITYALARRFVKIRHIGLVNVVAGREVAPEFVQGALRPRNVADALEPLLRQSPARAESVRGLAEVRGRLGTPGAAARVAQMAAELVR